jgi:hypothetical protein
MSYLYTLAALLVKTGHISDKPLFLLLTNFYKINAEFDFVFGFSSMSLAITFHTSFCMPCVKGLN